MTRCPASLQNPKGGQKTWMAETRDPNGQPQRKYLLCWTPPKRSLRDAARQIYRGKFDLWHVLSQEVTDEYPESRVQ